MTILAAMCILCGFLVWKANKLQRQIDVLDETLTEHLKLVYGESQSKPAQRKAAITRFDGVKEM